jgi:long-chain acyl-CoA synthetase
VLDYRTLDLQLRKGVRRLAHAGIKRGSRVLVVAQRKIDLMLAVLAAMGAGSSVLPVSANEEDLSQARNYFRPDLILLDRAEFWRSKSPASDTIVSVAEFDEEEPGEMVEVDPDDIGLLILTSGTTRGIRRGALLSHRALSGTAAYMNARMGVDDSVRDMVTAPLEHGFGMGRVRCALHLGGTAVFQSGLFSPAAVAAEVAERECNMLSAAVSAMTLLIDAALPALATSADRLRWIELGTGHLPHHHRELLLGSFPSTHCFVSYGLTEAIRCTFLELNAERDKIDSVGTPSPGIRVRLVDDQGDLVPPGQNGMIQIDGVNKASGYFDQAEAWWDKLDGQWLTTGDVGVMDADGYLTYVGRTDDMINVGGLKVAPQEVEEALVDILGKTAFAVAGIPDPQGIEGFVPALFIEDNVLPEITLKRVRDHLRERLPNFKVPRRVYPVLELPRTSGTRKIRRAALASLAQAIEEAALPDVPAIIARLSKERSAWPAFEGVLQCSRRRLGQNLRRGEPLSAGETALEPMLSALVRAQREPLPEIARLIAAWRELFALDFGDTLAVAVGSMPAIELASLALHALDRRAQVLWLQSSPASSLAADLGAVYRARARYVVIDSGRFSAWSQVAPYLRDSLAYAEFEQLAVTDEVVSLSVAAEIHERLGATPAELSFHRGAWQLRHLPVGQARQQGDGSTLWTRLREIAAGVFKIEMDGLSAHSTPDNTVGWDSLAFVSLIAEVEMRLGVRLSPRDIVSVESLNDLFRVLKEKQTLTLGTAAA